MNFRRICNTFNFEDDPFCKKAEGIIKIYHEVFFLMKFL